MVEENNVFAEALVDRNEIFSPLLHINLPGVEAKYRLIFKIWNNFIIFKIWNNF